MMNDAIRPRRSPRMVGENSLVEAIAARNRLAARSISIARQAFFRLQCGAARAEGTDLIKHALRYFSRR
jgi:hypothetical protein